MVGWAELTAAVESSGGGAGAGHGGRQLPVRALRAHPHRARRSPAASTARGSGGRSSTSSVAAIRRAGVPVLYIHDDHYHDDPATLFPDRACRPLPTARRGAGWSGDAELPPLGVSARRAGVSELRTGERPRRLRGRLGRASASPFWRWARRVIAWQIQPAGPGALRGRAAHRGLAGGGQPADAQHRLRVAPARVAPERDRAAPGGGPDPSLSTIFVVLEGQDPAGLRRAADALVPALSAIGPPWVGRVEDGVQEALAFLQAPRRALRRPRAP